MPTLTPTLSYDADGDGQVDPEEFVALEAIARVRVRFGVWVDFGLRVRVRCWTCLEVHLHVP